MSVIFHNIVTQLMDSVFGSMNANTAIIPPNLISQDSYTASNKIQQVFQHLVYEQFKPEVCVARFNS